MLRDVGSHFSLEFHLVTDRSEASTKLKPPVAVSAFASCDSGLRVLAAVASPAGHVLVGEDFAFRLEQISKELDRMQSAISKNRNLLLRVDLSIFERQRARHSIWQTKRAMQRRRYRLHCLAKELHNHAAQLLCASQIVIAPSLAVSRINAGLSKRWKRLSTLLSPAKFQKVLEDLCDRFGRAYVDACEDGSTAE